MAIVFLTIVSTGQCQNWCSQYSCDERNKYGGSECGGCDVCKPPPAPPLPPFGPQHCANTFEVCAQGFIGSCCIKPSDGCFKRTGRRFSQCRPFPTADRCVSDDTWTCPDDWIEPSPLPPSPPHSPSPPRQPPSPPCTPSWQFCDRTQCCADGNFACYKRKPSQGPSFVFGVNGTQCRFKAAGMGGMFTKKVYVGARFHMVCEESNRSSWLCPSWSVPSPPPPRRPVAPSPPHPPTAPSPGFPDVLMNEPCVEPFESCWGAMPGVVYGPRYAPLFCCLPDALGHPFTCMRHGGGGQYAMCRRARDDGSCIPADGWVCPHTPPPSPPPPLSTPAHLRDGHEAGGACHGNYEACWENSGTHAASRGCCSPDSGGRQFACMRRPGLQFAMCRPLPRDGPCQSDLSWQCPEAPPPAPPAVSACARNYASCVRSMQPHGVLELGCCEPSVSDGHPFGCFRRTGRASAQCRPMPPGPCVSHGDWACPNMTPRPSSGPPSSQSSGVPSRAVPQGAHAQMVARTAVSTTGGALIVGALALIVLCGGVLHVLQRIERVKLEQQGVSMAEKEAWASDEEGSADPRSTRKKKKKNKKDGRKRGATWTALESQSEGHEIEHENDEARC